MSNPIPQMNIDNRWVPCLPSDFGYMGDRVLCQVGKTENNPDKKLLLRYEVWGERQIRGVELGSNGAFGTRPPIPKQYYRKWPEGTGNGDQNPQLVNLLQQDVTGLVSLRGAVLQAAKEGKSKRIRELFFLAGKALEEFGNCHSSGTVPLQCPDSLAVGTNNQIVLLDAEFRALGGLPENGKKRYHRWFGGNASNGFADCKEAAFLHLKALLEFFQSLLDPYKGKPAVSPVLAQIWQIQENISSVPGGLSEEDFGKSLEGILYEPSDSETGVPAMPAYPVDSQTGTSEKKGIFFYSSLALNTILIFIILILLLLRTGPGTAKNIEKPQSGDVLPKDNSSAPKSQVPTKPITNAAIDFDLPFSSYCVVFPAQGTIAEKVDASLRKLFPDKVIQIPHKFEEKEKLLEMKMNDVIGSFKDLDQVGKLMSTLATKGTIRFLGYSESDHIKKSLFTIIDRGGVFQSGGKYYSLLQYDGFEKVVQEIDATAKKEAREELEHLKKVIHEYTSLKDALNIAGNRQAFAVQVEPTASGHKKAREVLLGQTGQPIFVAHPIPEIFDGIDPASDAGGGIASYFLKLDRKCFWRLVSQENRLGLDFSKIFNKDRMKWKEFGPGESIIWKPISVQKDKKYVNVASFDIGVVVGTEVVVFRNQEIFLGESKMEVSSQCQDYVNNTLKLNVTPQDFQDAIKIVEKGGQFTGTLSYSFLADRVTRDIAAANSQILERLDLAVFSNRLKTEDAPLD